MSLSRDTHFGGHMCWHNFNAFDFEALHWAFGNRSPLPQPCIVAKVTTELPDSACSSQQPTPLRLLCIHQCALALLSTDNHTYNGD